jgi:hypothetical protein
MTKKLQDTVGLLTPAVIIVLVFWVVVIGGFLVVVVVVVLVVVAGFHGVQGLSVDVVVVLSGGQSPAKEKDMLKSIQKFNFKKYDIIIDILLRVHSTTTWTKVHGG